MLTIKAEFKEGKKAEIPVTEVDTANKIFNLLDNDPLCERIRLIDENGHDATDQRYDLE